MVENSVDWMVVMTVVLMVVLMAMKMVASKVALMAFASAGMSAVKLEEM